MAAGNSVKPIPDGYHTITPYLRVRGAAKAIEFYKRAFGAEEKVRMPGPDGQTVMHAELRVGNSNLMLSDEFPQWGAVGPQTVGNTTGGLHLYVTDADAGIARAVAAGAKVTMPAQDVFWGDRYGKIVDPFGHEWSIAHHKEDLTPEQVMERGKAAMAQMCSEKPPQKK